MAVSITPGFSVAVGGEIWWGGFTAEITITNTSGSALSGWSYSFDSPHQLNSAPWGASLRAEPLENGLFRYTLSGADWGATIPVGGSVTVGFNGQQGVDLGVTGPLSQELLMAHESTSLEGVAQPESQPVVVEDGPNHDAMDHHDGVAAAPHSGDYIAITSWGSFHGSNHNSEHEELVGGRTAITTEALVAYNGLRAFAGLAAVELEAVGEWAFAQGLTNNAQAWGDDTKGVGLWYAMQGAKVGWIADEAYRPQILADIQRTARLGSESDVMAMVREFGHDGFADYIQQNGLQESFINTLKMEPHYGGWMHGRTHGFLDVEGVAIAHDINHLTVLGWDQSQPFMNDTFDWPQWPALDVSDQTVINYYQAIVALGDPLSQNLEDLATGSLARPEPDPLPSLEPLPPENRLVEIDPIVGSPLDVEVSGDLWWGGLTASLTLTNQSAQALDDWALSFTSAHRFYGEAWGVDVVTEQLAGGLYRYQLTGADWGQSIGAGESRTVGFNALAGTDLAQVGELSADALLADGSGITLL